MQSLNVMMKTFGWAQALSEDQFERIKKGIVVRSVPAGAYVCIKGESVEHWMGVVEGLVKMACNWTTGKTTTFTGVPPGGWFGEGSLLKNEPRKYDVIALRDSKVAFMNRSTFQWLLDHSIPFNRFLIIQLNERLGQFIGMMEHERLLDIDARLARCLAAMFNPVLYPGISRELQLSQEEIGFLAGVSRQRVNQGLRKLEESGLLRIDYGGITIVDLAGLRSFGE